GLDIDNIAVRPATGQLYGVSPNHLYRLDLATGAATQVDAPGTFPGPLQGKVSCSFDPVIDRLRVFSGPDSGNPQSMMVNPMSGAAGPMSQPFSWAPGSALTGNALSLRNVAYTN